MKRFYDKTKNSIFDLALEKFIKSEYLRDTASVLPLTLLTLITRIIFNFLITSRFQTSYYLLNFLLGLTVTVCLSLLSPTIYNGFNRTYKTEIENFSTFVLDSFWVEGWIFAETWKNRIFGGIGIFVIFILFFIEINSQIIQEFIFHIMISSIIVDFLTNIKVTKLKKEVNVKIHESPSEVLKRSETSYSVKEKIRENKKISVDIIDDYSLDSFANMKQFDESE